jgi:hypothetical protein
MRGITWWMQLLLPQAVLLLALLLLSAFIVLHRRLSCTHGVIDQYYGNLLMI